MFDIIRQIGHTDNQMLFYILLYIYCQAKFGLCSLESNISKSEGLDSKALILFIKSGTLTIECCSTFYFTSIVKQNLDYVV
jgi:hypothetical protein